MGGKDDKGKFTIGNLFAMHNGRPPIFESEDEFVAKIAEYLMWEEKTSKGKYTIEGCALYLGFASRQSLYDYKERGARFSYMVNRFLLFMQHYHAQRLTWVGSYQGSSFWLKNFGGYTEESTVNQNQNITANYGCNTIHTPPQPTEDPPSDKGEQ